MKLAQVGSIANKANAADAKSRAADCSVPVALLGWRRRNKGGKERVSVYNRPQRFGADG